VHLAFALTFLILR